MAVHNLALDWGGFVHKHVLELYRELLDLRRRELIPRLRNMAGEQKDFKQLGETAFAKRWVLGEDTELVYMANFGDEALTGIEFPAGRVIYATHSDEFERKDNRQLAPWSVVWYLNISTAAT